MAISTGQFSISVIDADGNNASMPVYFEYDDATSLSSLMSFIRVTVGELDSVTDGKVQGVSMQLAISLPLGLKASPVAGSNVQEVGLISYTLSGREDRSYGQAIPAVKQASLTGKVINQAETAMAIWLARMTTPSTMTHKNDDFGYALTLPIRKAVKVFRR
jgi:hypothetical protein